MRAGPPRAIVALGVVGLAVATYLTYVHYAGIAPICAVSHGCEVVQSSRYATFVGVPVAVLGLVGYLGILGSLALPGEGGRVTTAGLSLVGFGFSAYLTYLELFQIHAICQWCVASAIIMALLAVLSVRRALLAPLTEPSPSAASAAGPDEPGPARTSERAGQPLDVAR